MNTGCLRPLAISVGVLALFSLVLVGVYWDTFALMAENVGTMGEGRQAAAQLRSPDDLLAYLGAHPEHVSLVAFDVDEPEAGLYYRADEVRPVVAVPDLLVLVEYVRQVEAGEAEPAVRVPLAELRARMLPTGDGGAHERARAALLEAGAVDADGAVALRDVAEAAARWNDRAASDLLMHRLGREALAALPARLGLRELDPPLPYSGVFLSWRNHAATSTPEERLRDLQARSREDYARQVAALAATFLEDTSFRRRETEQLTRTGMELSLRQQRALAHATFAQGTAAGYGRLVASALQGALLSPDVSRRLRRFLDRPVPDTAGVRLSTVGSMGGGFPGLISFVGYAHRDDGGSPRVVVLLMEEVPISVFYHLLQTGLDKGLAVQLLGDDAFFDRARRVLVEAEG